MTIALMVAAIYDDGDDCDVGYKLMVDGVDCDDRYK